MLDPHTPDQSGTADWEKIQADLETAAQAAVQRYTEVVREFCALAGIIGDNVEQVLATRMVTLDGLELSLVPGTLSDPWVLQIVVDQGEISSGELTQTYKAMLISNALMVGSGNVAAIDPFTGSRLIISYMSMRDPNFNGQQLVERLNLFARFYRRSQDMLKSQHEQLGVVFA